MPELEVALDAAITGDYGELLARTDAADLDDIAPLFGDTPRQQNPLMAQVIADTSDKRSLAYKAAIRSVQRWRAAVGRERRTPSPAARRRLVGVVRVGVTREYRNGVDATITGLVRVSEDVRRRSIMARMAPALITPTLDRWAAGQLEAAADVFLRDFRTAYSGVPVEFEDVESVELEPL